MLSGCFLRPRYWVLLCLLVQMLAGCRMLGQDSPQPAPDLADASLENS